MIGLSERQKKILEIVKDKGPITGKKIADHLRLTRAALRPDLAVLTMSGFLSAKPKVGYTYKIGGGCHETRRIFQQYQVKDAQSMPVIVREDSSIYDAIVTLFVEDTGSIFVVGQDNYLTGVVSRKDLLKTALGQSNIHQVPISVIMTRMPNIITTSMDESLVGAVKKIVEHEIDSMPVVNYLVDASNEERLEVVGKISKTNIARLFLDLACSQE